jgi:L-ribulokinase
LYSWFRKLVNGPTLAVLDDSPLLSEQQKQAFAAELEQRTLVLLDRAASHLPPSSDAIVALDWINGRRTPNANQRLTLALQGVSLGCDAPTLYRALVEATAFGARAIIECFEQQGVAIDKIVGIGGIAKKSALVMQICADVFNKQIDIIDSEQSCARGAALCAAVAAGLYPSVQQAQQALAPAVAATYRPQAPLRHHYDTLYQAYTQLGAQEEGRHEHHTS